jgi:hypothetical protein
MTLHECTEQSHSSRSSLTSWGTPNFPEGDCVYSFLNDFYLLSLFLGFLLFLFFLFFLLNLLSSSLFPS